MRAVADLYAEEGYVVLAPDLFWRLEPEVDLGYGEADVARARDLLGRLDIDRAVADIAAPPWRRCARLPECRGKVGALGFCLGGRLAYLAAARTGVDAAVSYYGAGIEPLLGEAGAIRCPMVLHFAREGPSPAAAGARGDRAPPSPAATTSRSSSIPAPITASTCRRGRPTTSRPR